MHFLPPILGYRWMFIKCQIIPIKCCVWTQIIIWRIAQTFQIILSRPSRVWANWNVCVARGSADGELGNWMMTVVIAGTGAWASVWRVLKYLKPLNYGKISNICKSKEKDTTDPHVSITQLQELEFFATFVLSLATPFLTFYFLWNVVHQIPDTSSPHF